MHLAFCPERVVQGKAIEEIQTLAQIVSGMTQEAVAKAKGIFGLVAPEIVEMEPKEAEYAKLISYGPTNNKALPLLDAKVLALLPTSPANSKDALQFDVRFWADQGEELEKRFASWAAQ